MSAQATICVDAQRALVRSRRPMRLSLLMA